MKQNHKILYIIRCNIAFVAKRLQQNYNYNMLALQKRFIKLTKSYGRLLI